MSRTADPTRLPFDHYERYRLTARIASLLRRDDQASWRILDVGGHFGTLKLFLPDDTIFIADPKPPPEFAYREGVPFVFDGYVRAVGGSLPFKGESFHLVCAHDTLEHVPPEGRERFLVDVSRMAGRFLVLNGPFLSEGTTAAEQRIAKMWVEGLGATDHALDEHLRFGLPPRNLVEDVLRSLGMPFAVIPNGRLLVWLAMMAGKSFLQGLPDSDVAHTALDRAFNVTLAANDLGAPSYRLAFVAAREEGDRETIEEVRNALPAGTGQAPGEPRTAVHDLVDALQAHVIRVRGVIEELRRDQDQLNGVIEELRRDQDQLNERAREQARRIEELDRLVRDLTARLDRPTDPRH
jgi:hypothetical protein